MKKIISILLTAALLSLALISCSKGEKSYEKLAEHIAASSAAAEGVYTLEIGKTETDGVHYTRIARKNAAKIELELVISEGEKTLRTFTLVISRGNFDSYKWYYSSSVTNGTMNGVIIAEDFERAASQLGYMSAGTEDEYAIASMRAQAKAMCNYLLDSLEGDLQALDITAEDFGFKDYKD